MKSLQRLRRRSLTMLGGAAALALVLGALLTTSLVAAQSSDDGGRPDLVQDCVDRATNREAPRMAEFLNELVADGVVDQAQADEIERRLRDDAEDRCIARLLYDRGQAITVTAVATGTLESDVLHAMRDGGTLAGYAAEHGVSETDLIAAIMAPSHEAAAILITNGELEQAKADELLAEIEERVSERVNLTKDELPMRQRPIRDALGDGLDRLAKLVGR